MRTSEQEIMRSLTTELNFGVEFSYTKLYFSNLEVIKFFYNSSFSAKSWQNPGSIDINWVATIEYRLIGNFLWRLSRSDCAYLVTRKRKCSCYRMSTWVLSTNEYMSTKYEWNIFSLFACSCGYPWSLVSGLWFFLWGYPPPPRQACSWEYPWTGQCFGENRR